MHPRRPSSAGWTLQRHDFEIMTRARAPRAQAGSHACIENAPHEMGGTSQICDAACRNKDASRDLHVDVWVHGLDNESCYIQRATGFHVLQTLSRSL